MIYLFSFLWERKGFLLTKRRPFLSHTLSNPTARERLLHYVQVLFGAYAPNVLKFTFLKMRVSVSEICKFERKNDKAKYREMDLRVAT